MAIRERGSTYHRDEEDYGEYEEDEPEAPKLMKEEEDFLRSREQLKAKFRKHLKTQSACEFGQSQVKNKTVKNDTFGSFFGPLQPVIATRVLEESRSIRETKHITANASNKTRDPSSSGIKKNVHSQQPKVVNEVRKKAQTLKDMRDYSFLLSDDADLPSPAKEQPARRTVFAPNSAGRLHQAPLKSKVPTGNPVTSNFSCQEVKKPSSSAQSMHGKMSVVNESSISRARPTTIESKKLSAGGIGNGPHKTSSNKAAVNKVHTQIMGMNKTPRNVINDPNSKTNLSSVLPRSSVQNKYPEQKRLPQVVDKIKPTLKQPMHSSKTQPTKKKSSHAIRDEHKKRPRERNLSDEEDVNDYRSLIRGMFRYNPNKYAGMDEDDSDMEVGFDVIQKEEKRSSMIARKEDEEQFRLIEEEEARERQMRRMKRRLD